MKFAFLILVVFSLTAVADSKMADPFALNLTPEVAWQAKIIQLQYVTVQTILPDLKQQFKDASFYANERENLLSIKAPSAEMSAIMAWLKRIDRPLPQVLIRADIIMLNRDVWHKLGFLWRSEQNQPANGSFVFKLNQLGEFDALHVTLDALIQQGQAKILSSPRLITQDKMTAFIESGDEIPYQEATSSGATNAAFKKAVLRLKVTPTIEAREILLKLTVNQDKPSQLLVNGVPAIATRMLATEVLLKNNQSLLLGGIFEKQADEDQQQITGLGKIPFLGALFRHHSRHQQLQVLLILIRPEILK